MINATRFARFELLSGAAPAAGLATSGVAASAMTVREQQAVGALGDGSLQSRELLEKFQSSVRIMK